MHTYLSDRRIKKLKAFIVQFHEELQSFLRLTEYTMKTLTNYVNSDWEVRMSMLNEATVTESNDSKWRSERLRWQQKKRHSI